MEVRMTQQPQQPPDKKSHFDAAKEIVESLQGLDKTSQSLAMRFAAETLGLQQTSTSHLPAVTAPIVPAGSPTPVGIPHSTDIKQFTAAKAPKSDQQFAAVVAYFYRFEAPETQRRDSIDADFLLEATRQAGWKRPSNAGFTLNNAKNAGYLDVVTTGKYRINSVGENLVAMALPGNTSESSSAKSVKKKKSRKKIPRGPKKAAKTSR
jgi:hypothetical protein